MPKKIGTKPKNSTHPCKPNLSPEVNKELQEWLSKIAHDLRGPLSVVILYFEFLVDDLEKTKKISQQQREAIQEINSAHEKLKTLITKFLEK